MQSKDCLAGGLQISPLRLQFDPGQRVSVLTVRNDGDQASVIQLEVMAWDQVSGQDLYTESRLILATPPLFTLPPGDSQIVRVGLMREADTRREQTYRIFLQEVPSVGREGGGSVRVALRIGIPVFVSPVAKPVPPRLEWRLRAQDNGQWSLEAFNPSDIHIQVADYSLINGAGQALAEHRGMRYLLPGQRCSWPLALTEVLLGTGRASLKVVAHTDAGEITADIQPEP